VLCRGALVIDAGFWPTGGHQPGIHPGGPTGKPGKRSMTRH